MPEIWKKLGPKYLFSIAMKVPLSDFIQNMSQALKTADKSEKIGLFQKHNIAFEKLFLFWVPKNI